MGRSAAIVALVVTALACTTMAPPFPPLNTTGLNPDTVPLANSAAYTNKGPYDVGVITVEIEPGRKAEIWYPAPAGAATGQPSETYYIRDFLPQILLDALPPTVNPPFATYAVRGLGVASGGPFPLVLFSHGATSYRLQSTFLTTHLASWGFVVISPDYFERGIQSLGGTPPAPSRSDEAVAQLAVDATIALDTGAGPLSGKIDTTRLFPIGHSAGGGTSIRLAGSRTDVQSWIAMSAGVSTTPTLFNPNPTIPAVLANPNKAVMWITGANDNVAQLSGVVNAYNYSAGEKKLVIIPNSGHNNAMTDICEIARPEGGLTGLAYTYGLSLPDFVINLARDGCAPPNYEGPQVWPTVRHFITAELRYRSGLDAQPVGLGSGVTSQFGVITPSYQHAP